ncbi:MAG: hypothetical protein LBI85_05600, partial [Spirochaetaceae bacterium]|nr:hypothetical protein [Spirochaetaceae bacterium]
MFNLKLSAIAAGAALVFSLVIGIISRAGFPYVLVRALVSGGLFFFLSAFAYWAVSQFVPELLDLSPDDAPLAGDEIPLPGSTVDISIDSSGEDDDTDALPPLDRQYVESGPEARTASPETDRAPDFGAALPSGGEQKSENTGGEALDPDGKNGYTNGGTLVDAGSDVPGAEDGAAFPSETADAVDMLPDVELLSTAFISREEED